MGAAVHTVGPLDEKNRALAKLALAVGAEEKSPYMHAHVRKALELDLSADEIYHAILLAILTLGFPSTMAALTWAEDVLTSG